MSKGLSTMKHPLPEPSTHYRSKRLRQRMQLRHLYIVLEPLPQHLVVCGMCFVGLADEP